MLASRDRSRTPLIVFRGASIHHFLPLDLHAEPYLEACADVDRPAMEDPYALENQDFVLKLLRGRLPSGVKIAKRHRPGNALRPYVWSQNLFSCPAPCLLWRFFSEALRPIWQALDLGEFVETLANHTKAPLLVSVCRDDLNHMDHT